MTYLDAIAEWRRGRFIWGYTDCLMSVGDYIAANGGQDVSGRFRGSYTDASGAQTIIDQYGDMAGLIDLTGKARLPAAVAGPGDVVLWAGLGHRQAAGLRTEKGIAARLIRGVIEIDIRCVRLTAAWKI